MMRIKLFGSLLALTVLLGFALTAHGQGSRLVTGKVVDAGGPVAGISVSVKGSSVGTATDAGGSYSINVPSAESVLVFSGIGYASQEVVVGNRKSIDVKLADESVMMDELVVVGYGVQRKSHLTGAISKFNGENIVDIPVSDVAQALQGKITGVTIQNTSSEVGVDPIVRVRGLGSISAGSYPLVVIDGYPVSDGTGLSSINSSDIASIEVLKDAAAAAIYGSRAANGVIMVTTKSGSLNAPKYTVKYYGGLKRAYQLHDLMTSREYLELLEWQGSVGGVGSNMQARQAAWLEDNLGYTDWQRLALRDMTHINSIQASVSGGKKEFKYYVSGSYTDDQGLMLQNEVKKLSFRTKLDAMLSKSTTFGVNFTANYSQTDRPTNNFIDYYRTPSFLPLYHNAFSSALTGVPVGQYARGNHFIGLSTPTAGVDEYGNPTFDNAGATSGPFTSANNNPRTVLDKTIRANESFQSVGNVYLNISLTPNLIFRTSNGYNFRYSPQMNYYDKDARQDDVESTAMYRNDLYLHLLTENTLTWMKTYCRNHNFNLLVGYTLEKTRQEFAVMNGMSFPTDKVHTLNHATAFQLKTSSGGLGTGTYRFPDKILEGYLSRLTYSYKDKYLASASLRLDRSSIFAPGERGGWFPSASLGWVVSNEKFMKPVEWISQLKLRASYGVTGNNNIPANSFMNGYGSANYALGVATGTIVPGLALTSTSDGNPALTWEQTREFNYGLDLSLLRNKVTLAVDYYYSTTKSLLLEQPAPSFTGFTHYWNNIGRLRNKGIEIQLDTRNISHKHFNWQTNVNFSMNRNRILDLGGDERILTPGYRNELYLAQVGKPVVQYYGYKIIGVWNSYDEIAANPHFLNNVDAPGTARILDADNSGVLDANDRVALGNPYPDFTWGMTNTFQWKNFDLSFLIQGVEGISVFNDDGSYTESYKWNRHYTDNRWVSPSHPGDGMTPYDRSSGQDLTLTDYMIEDASYICLRSATIGYNFNAKLLKKIRLNGLRIYASGNNLLYFWRGGYRGIDPESRYTSSPYNSPLISGYQRGGFPITSTYTMGIDITF